MTEDSHHFVQLASGDDEETYAASANLFRGFIVASYAHTEFIFTDFICRCSNLPEYHSAMPSSLPYATKRRLALARKILNAERPLQKYAESVVPLLDNLLSFAPLRHMMVHGLMTYYYDHQSPDASRLSFRRYDYGEKKSLMFYSVQMSLEELGRKQDEVSKYAHQVVAAIYRLLDETKLPVPPVLEVEPL